MLNALQPWHLIILLVVIVLVFGSKKLPDAARSLGKSMRIFKSEVKELRNDGDDPAPTQVRSERVDDAPTSAPGPDTNHTDARPA